MCATGVDCVSRDPGTTAFKVAARLHQARWREARGFPMGTQPLDGVGARPLYAGCHLLTRESLERISWTGAWSAQCGSDSQTQSDTRCSMKIASTRTYFRRCRCASTCSALSRIRSQRRAPCEHGGPMFQASRTRDVEWSPGRDDDAYLGNRTSFDVAFLLDLGSGRRGILAIETKYHEHPIAVCIGAAKVLRYKEVARASGLFNDTELDDLMRGIVPARAVLVRLRMVGEHGPLSGLARSLARAIDAAARIRLMALSTLRHGVPRRESFVASHDGTLSVDDE